MTRLSTAVRAVILAAGSSLCSAACRSSDAGDAVPVTTLSVFAASSLTDAFRDLERNFERAHPHVDVELNFAGSQTLRLQIEQGARADVFASANESHVAALAAENLVSGAEVFAESELTVIVPRDDPAAIDSFEALPRARRLIIGTEAVPVGMYARRVLERAEQQLGQAFASAVRARVVSEESNVRLLRAKVELGEADAAIVYASDATSAKGVRAIAIPAALNVTARYVIARTSRLCDREIAAEFVRFVLSDEGRRMLERRGFSRVRT